MMELPTDKERRVLLATAVDAAHIAGDVLQGFARTGVSIEHKDDVNLVTEADRRSEQAIIDRIRRTYPGHGILAEERGSEARGDTPYRWIIDPLDGTTNFAHGFPVYCVSIAVELHDRPILGVVLDPTRQELFIGVAGQGATLNNEPLDVSRTPTLDRALLVTGFAYDIRSSTKNNLEYFSRFALRAQGLRRSGAAALDLCYVAAGRFDGFWEMKLHPWDMAAGAVIVEEAGGRMSDFVGGPFSIYGEELVATNGLIHREMLAVLSPTTKDDRDPSTQATSP